MLRVILLWLAAPGAIFTGLFVVRNVSFTFLLFYVGVCVLIPVTDLILLRKQRVGETLASLGFKDIRKNLAQALSAGVLVAGAVYFFFTLLQLQIMDISSVQTILKDWNIDAAYSFWFVPVMVLANSVVEELYWRGYIFAKLLKQRSGTMTVVLSSLFYASYHLLTTVALFSVKYAILCTGSIFAAGLAWGYIRLRTGSIWFPVITHFFADLGIMLVYLRFFT